MRRALRRLGPAGSWGLVVALAAASIGALGLVAIRDASAMYDGVRGALWLRQLGALGAGAVVALGLSRLDPGALRRRAYLIHGALVLAVVASFAGPSLHGARRWIGTGSLHIQPSELAKVGLVLALARALADLPGRRPRSLRDLLGPIACAAIVIAPVLAQPDLGTALLLGVIGGSMLALERLTPGAAGSLALAATAGLPLGYRFGLLGYQRARLEAFLGPSDPAGAGYQSAHALWLIGSGRWLGSGLGTFAGTEAYPLPYAHSDFVLAVWIRETGLAGAAGLLGLYLVLILAALRIAAATADRFGRLVALGVAATFFWQVVVNVGMEQGMLPVVGVTLPLMSFGGSSALASLAGVGLLAAIARRTRR